MSDLDALLSAEDAAIRTAQTRRAILDNTRIHVEQQAKLGAQVSVTFDGGQLVIRMALPDTAPARTPHPAPHIDDAGKPLARDTSAPRSGVEEAGEAAPGLVAAPAQGTETPAHGSDAGQGGAEKSPQEAETAPPAIDTPSGPSPKPGYRAEGATSCAPPSAEIPKGDDVGQVAREEGEQAPPAPATKGHWTDEEAEHVRRLRTEGATIAAIATFLGREEAAVRAKIAYMRRTEEAGKPVKTRAPIWTEEEIETAKHIITTGGVARDVANATGRPLAAARSKVWSLKARWEQERIAEQSRVAAEIEAASALAQDPEPEPETTWTIGQDVAIAEALFRGEGMTAAASAAGVTPKEARGRWTTLLDGRTDHRATRMNIMNDLRERMAGMAAE